MKAPLCYMATILLLALCFCGPAVEGSSDINQVKELFRSTEEQIGKPISELRPLQYVTDGPLHLVSIIPILQPSVTIDHLIVYSCKNYKADSIAYVTPPTECQFVLFGWYQDFPPFSFPEGVGFPINQANGETLMIQIKFTSHQLASDFGIQFDFSKKEPEVQAGILKIGQDDILTELVPNQMAYEIQKHCLPQCTFEMMEKSRVTVISSFLNMSPRGHYIRSERYFCNLQDYDSGYNLDYSWESRKSVPIKNIIVSPGEKFTMQCRYQIEGSAFGRYVVETCENHLLHYPVINNLKHNTCGSVGQPSDWSDLEVCGNKLGRYLNDIDACTDGITKEHICIEKDKLPLETCHDVLEYTNVFLPAGSLMSRVERDMHAVLDNIQRVSGATQSCFNGIKAVMCGLDFLPCKNTTKVEAVPLCDSTCTRLNDQCFFDEENKKDFLEACPDAARFFNCQENEISSFSEDECSASIENGFIFTMNTYASKTYEIMIFILVAFVSVVVLAIKQVRREQPRPQSRVSDPTFRGFYSMVPR